MKAKQANTLGQATPAGPAIRRTVSPRRKFRIKIPGVGTLTGPKRAVTSRGRLIVRPYTGQLTDGATAAAPGLDVRLRGAKLRRALTLTQRVGRVPNGSIAVFAHRRADGSWELKRARVRDGHIRIRTKHWSINIPSWLNPKEWVNAVGRRLASSVGGRTSPWPCPTTPNWMTVVNQTSTVHACGQENNDGAGERGEVRIKSNRGAVLQVTLAGPRDYAWVDGQPDVLRSTLGKATGTDAAATVFLPPGNDGMMTVGYRRPGSWQDYTLLVETTYRSVLVNLAYWLIDYAAGEASSRIKYGVATYMAAKCSGMLNLQSGTGRSPRDALSGAVFLDVLSCLSNEVFEDLTNPAKARTAALQLNDPKISRMESDQFAKELTKTAEKLRTFGTLLLVRPLLQQGWQGVADTVAALWTDGGSTQVKVSLAPHRAGPEDTGTGGAGSGPGNSGGSGGNNGTGGGNQGGSGGNPGGGTPPPPANREIVVYNQVTNDATSMREDTPAYLSTVMQNYCKRNGCALPGTDMNTGARVVAICQAFGARTTNGWDANPIDDRNPGLFESTRWYLIRWGDNRTGYLSEVWVYPQFRGGLGLRSC